MKYITFLFFFAMFAESLAVDASGVTSRVRISADESNKNWEEIFFGDRLKEIRQRSSSSHDPEKQDNDTLLPSPSVSSKSAGRKAVLPSPRHTVEYHIIQEESEKGTRSRQVKKKIITEPTSPEPRTHK